MACAMVASKSCFEKRVTSNNGEVVVEASCAQLNVSASSGAACKSDYACDNDAAHIIINEDTDIYDEIGGDGPYLVATGRENCYNNDTCDKNCDYCTTDEADYTNSVRPDDTTVNFQVAVDVGAKQQEKSNKRLVIAISATLVNVVILLASAYAIFHVAKRKTALPVEPAARANRADIKVEVFGAKRLLPDKRFNQSVMFESITKSVSSDFNAMGDSFKVASSSLGYSIYWMNIAVETAGGVAANVKLSDSYLVIHKNHTDYPKVDTVSRSGIVKLKADTHASIMSEFPTNEAFWSTFQLDNLMNPLVAFFVASSMPSNNIKPTVSFGTVFVNEGDAWDSRNTQRFVTPVSGIYCFSVSSAFVSQQIMNFQLLVNSDRNYDLAQSGGAAVMTSGVDLLASSRLIELSVDDKVSVHRVNGDDASFSFYSDTVNWAVSFSGFLYSTVNNVKVAWSVIRTTPGNTDYAESTVPFDKVLVNSGDVWNASLNAAVIPIRGLYYVYTTINTFYTGRGMFNVKVSGTKQFDVKFLTTNGRADQTRGNGAILRLKTGDRVTVEQPWLDDGVISLGHTAGKTSFYGMLVLPE